MRDDEFDVGYWLLDDQLVDADGRRCGRVDDVEFDGGPGEPARISAIVCGAGARADRLPPRWNRAAKRLLGTRTVRVPWAEVEDIDVTVNLKRPARELRLGAGDDDVGRVIGKLPGS